MTTTKKSVRITLITLLIYAFLVATHEGEYWPFSIYPMFSQAGNPWTRALVRDIADIPEDQVWQITTLDSLPGKSVSMKSIGVDQIDYSNFVVKTKDWNPKRVQALRTMLGENYLQSGRWMVYKVRGELTPDEDVSVKLTPWLLFERDTTLFNPNLPVEEYAIR